MLCEKCKKNEATAYIKTNVNGDVHEYHLCSECAAEMQNSGAFGSMFKFDGFDSFGEWGGLFSPMMSGFDMVSSLLSSPFGSFSAMPSLSSGKRCSVCGSDFRSIADSGKVGCPNCYTEFKGRLAPTIKKIPRQRLRKAVKMKPHRLRNSWPKPSAAKITSLPLN